jgi:hypothetical protein
MMPARAYPGEKALKKFVAKVRSDSSVDLQDIEDYPYEIHKDEALGLRLCHGDVSSYSLANFNALIC